MLYAIDDTIQLARRIADRDQAPMFNRRAQHASGYSDWYKTQSDSYGITHVIYRYLAIESCSVKLHDSHGSSLYKCTITQILDKCYLIAGQVTIRRDIIGCYNVLVECAVSEYMNKLVRRAWHAACCHRNCITWHVQDDNHVTTSMILGVDWSTYTVATTCWILLHIGPASLLTSLRRDYHYPHGVVENVVIVWCYCQSLFCTCNSAKRTNERTHANPNGLPGTAHNEPFCINNWKTLSYSLQGNY